MGRKKKEPKEPSVVSRIFACATPYDRDDCEKAYQATLEYARTGVIPQYLIDKEAAKNTTTQIDNQVEIESEDKTEANLNGAEEWREISADPYECPTSTTKGKSFSPAIARRDGFLASIQNAKRRQRENKSIIFPLKLMASLNRLEKTLLAKKSIQDNTELTRSIQQALDEVKQCEAKQNAKKCGEVKNAYIANYPDRRYLGKIAAIKQLYALGITIEPKTHSLWDNHSYRLNLIDSIEEHLHKHKSLSDKQKAVVDEQLTLVLTKKAELDDFADKFQKIKQFHSNFGYPSESSMEMVYNIEKFFYKSKFLTDRQRETINGIAETVEERTQIRIKTLKSIAYLKQLNGDYPLFSKDVLSFLNRLEQSLRKTSRFSDRQREFFEELVRRIQANINKIYHEEQNNQPKEIYHVYG